MIYLKHFELPDAGWEEQFLHWNVKMKMTCYSHPYPFQLFPQKHLKTLDFEPITILYGGNGSGKTTLLNIIAQRLQLQRGTYFNRSAFFDDYVKNCQFEGSEIPEDSQIITSDDVFNYLLEVRCANEQIDIRREELMQDFVDEKYASFTVHSLKDYEMLRKNNMAKRMTKSKYVKKQVMNTLPERSNGESAFTFFTEHIQEQALYLLDEPENSLAANLQQQLCQFLEDSARYFHCQFIIATHSPFLLAMKYTRIYDLDSPVAAVKRWNELENIRLYYEFFKKHQDEF